MKLVAFQKFLHLMISNLFTGPHAKLAGTRGQSTPQKMDTVFWAAEEEFRKLETLRAFALKAHRG